MRIAKTFLGRWWQLRNAPLEFIMSEELNRDFVKLAPKLFFAGTPKALEELLLVHGKILTKQTRGYKYVRTVLGNGLVTSDGELWKAQRKTIQPSFHREKISQFVRTVVEATEETVSHWSDGAIVSLQHEMSQLTLKIICQTVLAIDVTEGMHKVGGALDVVNEYLNDSILNPTLPLMIPSRRNRAFKQAMQFLDSIFREAIRSRLLNAKAPNGGLLDMLLHSCTEGQPDEIFFEQVRDELATMLLAGHETTATALTWTLYLLNQHPQILEQVRREIDEVVGTQPLTFEHTKNLRLLERVCKESLRLYCPIWSVGRSVAKPVLLFGEKVKPGDIIFISPYVMHRRQEVWKNAHQFDPSRFLPEREALLPKCAYMPFLVGTRKCVGDLFAMLEMQVILAHLLPRFDFECAVEGPVVPEPLVTLRPKGGLPMRMMRRQVVSRCSIGAAQSNKFHELPHGFPTSLALSEPT